MVRVSPVETIYAKLRERASRLMARERPDHTLQATALVHEVWIDLRRSGRDWTDANFFPVAAKALRSILAEYARRKASLKRGGSRIRISLEHCGDLVGEGPGLDLLMLDEALDILEEHSPALRRVVELRVFCGFTHAEVAQVLDFSENEARRDWLLGRAWLNRHIGGGEEHARVP